MVQPRFLILFLSLILVSAPAIIFAKSLVSLRIFPAKVGVFYQNKTQQFQAFGVFNDGSEENYTSKVGWSIEANPHPEQALMPEQVATIDTNGLATVRNTWGKVNVVVTYPKPLPPPVARLAGVYNILLKVKCDSEHLALCVESRTCENAGGYWWVNGECRSEAIYLPGINFLLLKKRH